MIPYQDEYAIVIITRTIEALSTVIMIFTNDLIVSMV